MAEARADFILGKYSITTNGIKWTIAFHVGGKMTITTNGDLAVEGIYTVTNDEIEITDERGPRACHGDEKTGKYKWRLEGTQLIVTKVQDRCEGRAHALTSQPWMPE